LLLLRLTFTDAGVIMLAFSGMLLVSGHHNGVRQVAEIF